MHVVYALFSCFFLVIFLIKYHIEYLLVVPVVIPLFAQYTALAMQPASSAQKPEKLFREHHLIATVILLAAVFVTATFVKIPLARNFSKSAIHQCSMTQSSLQAQIDWDGIRLVVFDEDGTLYQQRPLRMKIGRDLAAHAIRNRDLKVVSVLAKVSPYPRANGQ